MPKTSPERCAVSALKLSREGERVARGHEQAIAEFGSRIGGSEVALFYFAGHGIQVKNQNYLMPVNARIESEASVPYQGVNLNQVLDEMDNGKSGANIVMLDACRNNPITGKFRSGQSRGLASPGSAPKGTVIVYATDPGNVASDGTGRNGLFTAGLLTAFKGKDLTLDGVLTAASAEVEKASGQTQTPYVNGPKTLQKSFHFHVTVEPGRGEIEKTFWTSIERSNDAADFEAYLQKYPAGSYKALAENRLKKLKADQQASSAPSLTAPPAVSSAGSSTAFDGRWAVTLVCEDAADSGKVAKGYTLNFFSDVKEGRLTGQDGKIGQPGYLSLVGIIKADGSAEIKVNGLIGNPKLCGRQGYLRHAILLPHARHLHADERQGNAHRTQALRSHVHQELTRYRGSTPVDPRKSQGDGLNANLRRGRSRRAASA